MNSQQKTTRAYPKIIMCVAFPPPVNGSTKNCKKIATLLESRSLSVHKLDLSLGALQTRRGIWRHIAKARKYFRAEKFLIKQRIARHPLLVYHVPNGGGGQWYTLSLVFLARLLNLPVILHHRTYQYIDRRSWAMRLTVAFLQNTSSHVFLTPGMQQAYFNQYNQTGTAITLSNTALNDIPARRTPKSSPGEIVRIGYLSALSAAKGCRDTIDAYIKCCDAIPDYRVELHIAGPPMEVDIQERLAQLSASHSDKVVLYGEIGGKDKEDFFEHIDIFCFPTRYKKEAQPNVIFEALARGVPVATRDRGCIREMLPENGDCLIVGKEEDFSLPFVEWLKNLLGTDNADRYHNTSRRCLNTLRLKNNSSEQELKRFFNLFETPCTTAESQ